MVTHTPVYPMTQTTVQQTTVIPATQQTTVIPATTAVQPQTVVVTQAPQQRGNGNCPTCGMGTLRDRHTLLGLVLAIVLFPVGLLCFMLLTERRCTNCGAVH